MNKEYKIKTLADFVQIPEEKIGECLADFRLWISLARQAEEVSALMREALGEPSVTFSNHGFTWLDDGMNCVSAFDLESTDGTPAVRIDVSQGH